MLVEELPRAIRLFWEVGKEKVGDLCHYEG